MSATVNTTLTITSSNLTSDVISLTLPTTLLSAVQGGMTRVKLATSHATTAPAGSTVLATAEQYPAGSKLWVYNPSTTTDGTERIHISLDEATSFCTLKGGDWAVIPWTGTANAGDLDIEAYGQTAAGQVLEYGVFGV